MTSSPGQRVRRSWRRPMLARSRDEPHRASTPLELLFDLCFVVAVAQAAAQLHRDLVLGKVGPGILGYAIVFFAIWWAWMNFSWFASAYDTDDVPYRLLTLVQIAGVLILAAGVPSAFEKYDFRTVVIGYVVMRVALVTQWLRAAVEYPAGRPAAVRYAIGVTTIQIFWVARLALHSPWTGITFVILVVAELLVPIWAEYRGTPTSWHPEHINERYGLFTLIVLGECVAASTVAIQSASTDHGISASLLTLAAGSLLLVFGLWWSYFKTEATPGLRGSLGTAIIWGYGHYFIFGAIAALGAGVEVAAEKLHHAAELSTVGTAFCVAIPVVVFLIVAGPLHALMGPRGRFRQRYVVVVAVLILVTAAISDTLTLSVSVVIMGLLVAALVAGSVLSAGSN